MSSETAATLDPYAYTPNAAFEDAYKDASGRLRPDLAAYQMPARCDDIVDGRPTHKYFARQHKIEEDITFIRTKFSQAVNLGGTAPLLSIYKWQGLRDYYGDPDLKLPIAERTTLEFERRQSMFEITNFLFGVHAGQTNGEKFETTGDVLLRKQALFREWRGGNPGPILAAPAAAVRTSTTASISAPAPAPGDQQQ